MQLFWAADVDSSYWTWEAVYNGLRNWTLITYMGVLDGAQSSLWTVVVGTWGLNHKWKCSLPLSVSLYLSVHFSLSHSHTPSSSSFSSKSLFSVLLCLLNNKLKNIQIILYKMHLYLKQIKYCKRRKCCGWSSSSHRAHHTTSAVAKVKLACMLKQLRKCLVSISWKG